MAQTFSLAKVANILRGETGAKAMPPLGLPPKAGTTEHPNKTKQNTTKQIETIRNATKPNKQVNNKSTMKICFR